MVEYFAGAVARPEDPSERLRRAETLARIGLQFRFDQPLSTVLDSLAADIVENTRAICAAVILLRNEDLTVIAQGEHNLPEGYLSGMAVAYQNPERAETLREAVANGRTWVVRDGPAYMLSQPEYAHMHHLLREVQFQTLVTTPFLERAEVIGIVGIYYGGEFEVEQSEIDFARAIAQQAAPVMDNAWLFQAAQRRAAELEALSRADLAMHESILLENVIQAMIDLAVDLFKADRSLFLTFDVQGRFHAAATHGVSPEQLAGLQEAYSRIERSQFANQGPELGIVEDVANAPRIDPAIKRQTTSASSVDIPVFAAGEFFGMFVLGYLQRRTFDDDDRRLLRTLAGRAGLAIQNALFFEESQKQTRELEALYRADAALHRSLNLGDVLQAMADLALELLGADSSLVATWQEDDRLGLVAWSGIPSETVPVYDRAYRAFDRQHFERYNGDYPIALIENPGKHLNIAAEVRATNPGSFAEVPVVVNGELFGIFSIGWYRPRKFGDEDRQLFDAFASRASLAIQNALHFDQAQVTASLEERQRIARELHDSVSQALYGIGLGARTLRRRLGDSPERSVAEPVEYIINLAEGGLAETRALIFELMPDSLETDGLVTALQRQSAATQARHNVKVDAALCDEPELPLRTKEALYRIAQESLHNMAKHAHARSSLLSLAETEEGFELTVRDDGVGFDTGGEFPGHLGLRSMAERARKAGCEYSIESAPGLGTTVTVRVTR